MNYYIQGNKEKADQIKAAFEKLGIDVLDFGFADKAVVYFSIGGCVQCVPYSINIMNILHSHPDYKELPLPKPHYDINTLLNSVRIKRKKVLMMSLNGEIVGEYSSAREAARVNKIPVQNISSCCLGRLNKCGGEVYMKTREDQIMKIGAQFAIDETDGQTSGRAASMRGVLLSAFRAGAHWADSYPNWISVEDELPKENEEVLAYNAENEEVIACDYHHKMFRCWPEAFGKSITHWMPLPQPPRKED